MIEHVAVQFWWLSHNLLRVEQEIKDRYLDEGWRAELGALMVFIKVHCQQTCEFSETAMLPVFNVIAMLEKAHLTVGSNETGADVAQQLKAFRQIVEVELGARKFVYVPQELSRFFENDSLFTINLKFLPARQDMINVGNCLAVGLPDACIFHLMRIAEHGLRALAKKLRVRLTHTGKSYPISSADWNAVIEGCKNRIKDARSLAAGPRRSAKFELYSDAGDHCVFMKDIWRNTISHARKTYTQAEAIAAYERVRDFMLFLDRNL